MRIASPLLTFSLPLLLGCGGSSVIPRANAPQANTGVAKCSIAASQTSPLVTEWPASEKANLEGRLRSGGVVVSYSGCEMRLLQTCQVRGNYVWQRTTPATDVIDIRNEDELYSKLPLGAVALEGELRASGRLTMKTTISGQLHLQGLTPNEVPQAGPCQGATHLVGALSVGAFNLKSGGALSAGGGVGTLVGDARAGTSSSEVLVREAGNAERCVESTDTAPHQDCGSPIQVFLWPLPWAQPEQGPPGMSKINFVSADADTVWDVVGGGQTLCHTPCSKWLDPSTAIMMKEADSPWYRKADSVKVPDLRPYAGQGPLEVRSNRASLGLLATGLTFTALAGGAALTGIVLTAVGCSDTSGGNRSGLCVPGIVTGVIGLAILAPSIVLIVKSGAEAEVLPTGTAFWQAPQATGVQLAPGALMGRF